MLCFEGTIIFCSRLKIHRKISLKKVTLKSGCLNCNVRNTLSSAHTFKVLRANQSIFLLGTKATLKILSRYVWTLLMNILRSKLGLKILILVSEHNVRNMESPNYVRAKLSWAHFSTPRGHIFFWSFPLIFYLITGSVLYFEQSPHSLENLSILENLAITWWYTDRPTFRLSAPQAYQCLISHFLASLGAFNLILNIAGSSSIFLKCICRVWARRRHCTNPALQLKFSLKI